MQRYVHEENILLHRKLLAETTDKEKRKIILRLAEEEAKELPPLLQRRNELDCDQPAAPSKDAGRAISDRQVVFNKGHAGRRPSGVFGGMSFIPIIDLAIENDLIAVLHCNADRIGFDFGQ